MINYKLILLTIFYIIGILCSLKSAVYVLPAAALIIYAAAKAPQTIRNEQITPGKYSIIEYFNIDSIGQKEYNKINIIKSTAILMCAVFLCAYSRGGLIIFKNSIGINSKIKTGAFVKITGTIDSVYSYQKRNESGRPNDFNAIIMVEKYYDARNKKYIKTNGRILLKINNIKINDNQFIDIEENGLIEVSGYLEKIHKYQNPLINGGHNPLKNEILFRMRTHSENVTIIKRGGGIITSLKRKINDVFDKYYPDDIAGFLKAFALGNQSGASDSIYFDNDTTFNFYESGLLHVMVVSGGHVTLMIAFISSALGILKTDDKIKLYVLFIAISLYFLIIGFQAAVTRAYTSFAVYTAAALMKRDISRINIFITAFFIHIVIFPEFIFSPGFWLSYISTFAIILACEYEIVFFNRTGPAAIAFIQYCKICLAALIFTYPAVCYISGYFPLNSVIANLFTLWLYEIILALCLIFAVLSAISETLAWCAAAAIYHLTFAALKINEFIASFPAGNIALYKLKFIETILLYIFLCAGIYFYKHRGETKHLNVLKIAIIIFILIFIRTAAIKYNESPEVIFLDTGQGDCALIKTMDNKWIMIDAGGSASSYSKALIPFLRYRNINEIEYLIISHAHSDHYLNAIYLLKNPKIKIKKLYYSHIINGEKEFEKMLAHFNNKKVIYAGYRIKEKEALIDILWPPAGGAAEISDCNDSSIVISACISGKKILFCGDITETVENRIIPEISRANFDFIKAPHHGSITSNSEKFIIASGARGVFIPSAQSNKFGHPHKIILNRYKKNGYKIYNSQNSGGIILKIGKNIKIIKSDMKTEFL